MKSSWSGYFVVLVSFLMWVFAVQDVKAQDGVVGSMSAMQMKKAAVAFIESLPSDVAEAGMFALSDEEKRTTWSNLPAIMYDRIGIRIGDLSDEQRRRLHDLIRASTSSQGYLKISGLFWMEDILQEQSQERLAQNPDNEFFARLVESWNSKNYWVSFYGNPSK